MSSACNCCEQPDCDRPILFELIGFDALTDGELFYKEASRDYTTFESQDGDFTYSGATTAGTKYLVKVRTVSGVESHHDDDTDDATGAIVFTSEYDPETGVLTETSSGVITVAGGRTYTADGIGGFVRTGTGPFASVSEDFVLSIPSTYHFKFKPVASCFYKIFWTGVDEIEYSFEWEPPSVDGFCVPADFDDSDQETWPRTPDYTTGYPPGGEDAYLASRWSCHPTYEPPSDGSANGFPA